MRLRQSPRAFIPPAMDLAGNDILDSLSGKLRSRPTTWPTPRSLNSTVLILGPSAQVYETCTSTTGAWGQVCVSHGDLLHPRCDRQLWILSLLCRLSLLTLRLTPKVNVHPGETESDTQRPEMPKRVTVKWQ